MTRCPARATRPRSQVWSESASSTTASHPTRRPSLRPAPLFRASAELDADLFLLDPRAGARGLADQIAELRDQVRASSVTLVDVGGDILARGDEPTLRSPLADSLVLAAIADLNDATVLVAGAGIDGELPESSVFDRYEQLGAERLQALSPADVAPFRSIFDWHPSEASGLLCAAAAGVRGTAEIRDRGFPVALNDATPEVWRLRAHRVVDANRIAKQLRSTSSLEAVETVLRESGPGSEIDYERRKAAHERVAPASPSTAVAPWPGELAQIRAEAAARGVDFITLRGLAERMGVSGADLPDLQRYLISRRRDEYAAPLWTVRH